MARTPGPWAYDPTINRIFSTVTNECVAAPHVPGNPAADAAWPDDARVLAAWPEMLEALKALVARIKDAREDEAVDASTVAGAYVCGDVWSESIEAADVAIAKSEGRA